MGYHRAGFDVVGIDIEPQPNYPFEFIQHDAIDVLASLAMHGPLAHSWYAGNLPAFVSAVHASPPCQDWSRTKNATGRTHGTAWMLGACRHLLTRWGRPWVIENVPGAEMRTNYKLCGCMFDLPGLRRERWFETSWPALSLRPSCLHIGEPVTVAGHGAQGRQYRAGVKHTQDDRRAAMGIDWMNRDELSQAIPPAYTQFIGEQLLDHLRSVAA